MSDGDGRRNRDPRAIGLIAAAAILVLDQVTKLLVVSTIAMHQRIDVTPFFELTLLMNRGVSFGMFSGLGPWGPWILSGVAVAVAIFLLHWLRQENRLLVTLALGLVIGGALGNLIDRLRLGAVVDFLYFHAGPHYWPAFNVADSAIVCGAALLVYDGVFAKPAPDDRALPGDRSSSQAEDPTSNATATPRAPREPGED